MDISEFFVDFPEAKDCFNVIKAQIEELGPSVMRVSRSQIGFYRVHGFAYIWVPGKYLKSKCAPLALSVLLNTKLEGYAFKEIVGPKDGKYIHHLEIKDDQGLSSDMIRVLMLAYQQAE